MMNTTQKRIRYSATRDVIYNYLCGTKEHPSADMIYSELKPTMPTLSLGTVYTNLKLFEGQGKVVRVANVNGHERYDANCEEHVHFICDSCNRVIDVMDADVSAAKNACSINGAQIKRVQLVLRGTCAECSK